MDTLYHYCPTKSFLDIISNRSIRLSSLSLSNDTMEGRLVSRIFERFVEQSDISSDEKEYVRDTIEFVEGMFDGLGFCLSEKPDTLSQWRGYADDGRGFSIGFSKSYLDALSKDGASDKSRFRLDRVLYKQSEHEAVLKPIFEKILKRILSGELKQHRHRGLFDLLSETEKQEQLAKHKTAKGILMLQFLPAFPKVHILKSDAFSEEYEWRLISYLSKSSDAKVSFTASRDRLIPYREFAITPLGGNAINEIYIGPKNITPDFVVERMLAKYEFANVEIIHSTATYR